uniref:Putative secreted protein n=1 Tax=Ixodes ricinus TaxID=34613 RepID=A0A6B0TUY7_IXORI
MPFLRPMLLCSHLLHHSLRTTGLVLLAKDCQEEQTQLRQMYAAEVWAEARYRAMAADATSMQTMYTGEDAQHDECCI